MEEKREIPQVRYETRISNKTGNSYDVLVISYKGYEKPVFLNDAEKFVFNDLKNSQQR